MSNGQNEEKMKTVTQIKIKVFASVVVNPIILHTITAFCHAVTAECFCVMWH